MGEKAQFDPELANLKPGRQKPAHPGWLRRFIIDPSGAAALEFAFAAPVFFLAMFAIFDVSLMFYTSTVIEGAAEDAARQIRTGVAQQATDPLQTFQDRLCAGMLDFIDCTQAQFQVKAFQSFGTVNFTLDTNPDGTPLTTLVFEPGGSGAITVVQVTYRWEFAVPMIGHLFSDNGTNSMLLTSSAVFRNEPYEL